MTPRLARHFSTQQSAEQTNIVRQTRAAIQAPTGGRRPRPKRTPARGLNAAEQVRCLTPSLWVALLVPSPLAGLAGEGYWRAAQKRNQVRGLGLYLNSDLYAAITLDFLAEFLVIYIDNLCQHLPRCQPFLDGD